MTPVPPVRELGYAVLATLVAVGVWWEVLRPADGGWIFAIAVALFVAAMSLDEYATARTVGD